MITINQQPEELTPAYNEMNYHVSSDNTTEDNFRFVCDIYIDGSFVRREKRSKHPDYTACVFDIHRIVEAFVTQTIEGDITNFGSTGSSTRANDWCKVVCNFGEEYGLSSSGTTVYPDLETSDTVYAFNGAINTNEFVDWSADDYILDSSGASFCMTLPLKTSPFADGIRGNNILRNQNYFAYTYTNSDYKVDRYVIITYDSNGNFIEEYQIENGNSQASTQDSDKFNLHKIGYNVNNVDVGSFITGTPPVYTDDVYYAKIYTIDSLGIQTSEAIWLKVLDKCSAYEQFEVHWLDRLGAVNTFVFDNIHTENTQITSKEYRKQNGTMSSTAFTLSKSDRGAERYFTSSETQLNLKSDWITQNEYDWLKYLTESPQVWIYVNGEYISMNVVSTSYESKKTVNTTLINFEIILKYSQRNYRQRS